jgi:hypothetical protein
MLAARSLMLLVTTLMWLAVACGKGDSARKPEPSAPPSVEEPQSSPGSQSTSATSTPSPDRASMEYFPLVVGSRWVYRIETSEHRGLNFRGTIWPTGPDTLRTLKISGSFPDTSIKKTFTLEFRLRNKVSDQERATEDSLFGDYSSRTDIFELEIIKDDLGIFDLERRVFWAVIRKHAGDESPVIEQAAIYLPDISRGVITVIGAGWSRKALFFIDQPGAKLAHEQFPEDATVYIGIDRNVPQHENATLLRFRRTMERREGGSSTRYEDSGFSEDFWYARNVGLVRMEQKVLGRTTVVWTLTDFALGSGVPPPPTATSNPATRALPPAVPPGSAPASTAPISSPLPPTPRPAVATPSSPRPETASPIPAATTPRPTVQPSPATPVPTRDPRISAYLSSFGSARRDFDELLDQQRRTLEPLVVAGLQTWRRDFDELLDEISKLTNDWQPTNGTWRAEYVAAIREMRGMHAEFRSLSPPPCLQAGHDEWLKGTTLLVEVADLILGSSTFARDQIPRLTALLQRAETHSDEGLRLLQQARC